MQTRSLSAAGLERRGGLRGRDAAAAAIEEGQDVRQVVEAGPACKSAISRTPPHHSISILSPLHPSAGEICNEHLPFPSSSAK